MEFFAVSCEETNMQSFVQARDATEILIWQRVLQGALLAGRAHSQSYSSSLQSSVLIQTSFVVISLDPK